MNRIVKSIALLFLLTFMFSACGSKTEKKDERSRKPHTVGITSEVLVVTNDVHWKGCVGDSIRAFFGQDVPGLPQVEPIFTLPNIPISSVNNKMFKRHRNLFIVEYNDSLKKPYVETKKDLWAAPQRVIKINTPDDKGFFDIFNEHKNAFMTLFHDNEIRRIQQTFEDGQDIKIRNRMMRNYDFSVVVPRGFFVAAKYDDFIWLRKETPVNSQGLMIYTEDYKSTEQFKHKSIMMRRNRMTRKHIPGPKDGSYMITSKLIESHSKEITFNGKYGVETRGLWEVEGDFMGGPYMSYTFVDEKRNKLITLDGYVYSPGKDKRDLLLQLEAIMKSIEIQK